MKHVRIIFNDWLTRTAGIIFLLIVVVVLFDTYSPLPQADPMLGVITFGMVPVLFIAGGIIFILAILRS